MTLRIAIVLLVALCLEGQAHACVDDPVAPEPQAQAEPPAADAQPGAAPENAKSWKQQARFFPLSRVKISPKAMRMAPKAANAPSAAPAGMPLTFAPKASSAPGTPSAANVTPQQAKQLLSIYQ